MGKIMNEILRKLTEEKIPIDEWKNDRCYIFYSDVTFLIREEKDGFTLACIIMQDLLNAEETLRKMFATCPWKREERDDAFYLEPDYVMQAFPHDIVFAEQLYTEELKELDMKEILDTFLKAYALVEDELLKTVKGEKDEETDCMYFTDCSSCEDLPFS